jgi:zinc protease
VTIAERSVFRSLYGDGHPHGYRDTGAPVGVRSATREEVLGFWSEHFVPSNTALVVSGQVTLEELRPMVEEAFGGWPAAEESQAIVAEPRTTDARLVLVDRPGAPQTELRVVMVGVPRSTPDFEAVALMNTILGGLGVSPAVATNFSSRIMLNLREEHGYTYGAVSQFVFRRTRGPFWSGGTIRTDATAPAVTEILNEIRRIRDEPVTEEELALARDSQIRSIASQYQTSTGVTAATAGIHINDLSVDYYPGLATRLSAVTIEDVQEAARQHLDPDQMIVVAVGDLATIRAPLEALGRGRVEIRDAEGNVIP